LILCSVESSEVDLSEFQDAEDGTNVPSDNDAGQPAKADAAPQQEGAGGFQILKNLR
jgi:DNA replication licensing factor MCM6